MTPPMASVVRVSVRVTNDVPNGVFKVHTFKRYLKVAEESARKDTFAFLFSAEYGGFADSNKVLTRFGFQYRFWR